MRQNADPWVAGIISWGVFQQDMFRHRPILTSKQMHPYAEMLITDFKPS